MTQKTTSTKYLAGLFLLMLAIQLVVAEDKDKHLPLPPQIAKATTVYIDNQTGVAEPGDRCYTEIEKWGRFKVVQNPKGADLVLLLSIKEYTGGYVTGSSTSTINIPGPVSTTTQTSRTRPVTVGHTYLTVIDPKTGENLWGNSRQWRKHHSATKDLVDDLIKRINEDAKQSR